MMGQSVRCQRLRRLLHHQPRSQIEENLVSLLLKGIIIKQNTKSTISFLKKKHIFTTGVHFDEFFKSLIIF